MSRVQDMTVGSPVRHLVRFSWPLLVGNIIQNAYFLVDAALVGRLLGADALAAIGGVMSVIFVVLGFVFGLSLGVGVMTAQRFGAQDPRGVRLSVGTGAWVCLLSTAAMTLLCLLLTDAILRLLQTPPAIFALARTYLSISFWGTGFMVFFNFQSATLRAFGDSRTPLWCLVASSLLNIALDLPFIRLFGIAGAAWATNLATLLSALGCLCCVTLRLPQLRLRRSDWRPRLRMALAQLRIGIPMGLQFSITGLGAMVLQRAINTFGVAQIAGMTAARNLESIAVQLPIALGQAMATYSAQNTGAGRFHRIREGVRASALIVILCGGLFTALALLFSAPFIRLFIASGADAASPETAAEAIAVGCRMVRITSPFLIPLGAIFIFRNTLQGIGRSLWPMLAGGVEMLMRVSVALLLLDVWGVSAVYWGDPLAWIGACALLIPVYLFFSSRWPRQAPPTPFTP